MRAGLLLLALTAAALLPGCRGCGPGGAPVALDDTGELAADPGPGAARLYRLTEPQLRHAVEDLTGVVPTSPLPVDYDLHGYDSVGAGELTIAPYDLELYETMAWEVAEAVFPSDEAVSAELGCAVTPSPAAALLASSDDTGAPLGAGSLDTVCVQTWASALVAEAWRRPATSDEVDPLVDLFEEVHGLAGERTAAQAVLATTLLSADFLFRVELGEPDPDDLHGTGDHQLTDWELASRLAFFLTDAPPDAALRAAAAAGDLDTEAGIREQAERLLATERGQEAMTRFFVETLDLDELSSKDKDAGLFPADSETLRAAMQTELEVLFADIALHRDADMRTLLTTRQAWVSPELAALYGLDDVTAEGWVTLPEDQGRGGLLGRAGFLTLNATAARTSPTHRGLFVRSRLLCQDVPPPPEGVVASLDGIDSSGTLRETLEQHLSDPACSSCHALIDPIGFTLEDFDGLGQWRATDNGQPVDATGDLDGVEIDGAAELGAAVAEHERFSVCLSAQLFRHATGALEGSRQEALVDELDAAFVASGYRFGELVLALVTSPGFRGVAGPLDTESCEVEGETRACATDCAAGLERCIDGLWQGCDADPASPETCDAVDNDCDGLVDGTPLQVCTEGDLPGVQSCEDGAWRSCSTADPPPEVCNGLDDDGDGLVDDGLSIELVALSWADLQDQHASCDPDTTGVSGPCGAATHRLCAARGCDLVTGMGLLARDLVDETAAIACFDGTQAEVRWTTFTELGSFHEYCVWDDPITADCNASIHRYCAAHGYGSGYGPIEHSGDTAVVACTAAAENHTVDYDALTALQSGCSWPDERNSDACKLAMHQWCVSEGYATGFGPQENWDNLAVVACLPHPEDEG